MPFAARCQSVAATFQRPRRHAIFAFHAAATLSPLRPFRYCFDAAAIFMLLAFDIAAIAAISFHYFFRRWRAASASVLL
jgi:hypothetical protein